MDIRNPFYINTLKVLNENKVEYILVGGIAVGYYGYARYTADMDLWVNPSEENINRLYKSLIAVGYEKLEVKRIKKNRSVENATPIRLFDDHGVFKIDLMTNTFQTILTWKDCIENINEYNIEGVNIPIIHINHLITMKENTKRLDNNLKDLVDADELKKIQNLIKNN